MSRRHGYPRQLVRHQVRHMVRLRVIIRVRGRRGLALRIEVHPYFVQGRFCVRVVLGQGQGVKMAGIDVFCQKQRFVFQDFSPIYAFNLVNKTFWILNCSWLNKKFTWLIFNVFVLLNQDITISYTHITLKLFILQFFLYPNLLQRYMPFVQCLGLDSRNYYFIIKTF